MSDARNSERSEGTTTRVPFGSMRLKMQLSKEDQDGFKARKRVTRWFNDAPGRIERALAGGYNFVKPEDARSLGQGALHGDSTDPSKSRVSLVVSRGDPIIRAYLMEIKEKYFKEDQVKKEAINSQVDDALALGGKTGGSEFEQAYKPN